MRLYPLALKTAGRRCLVVGGGRIAARKARSLLECGADVRVVSPEFVPELEDMAADGAIKVATRPFEPEDLDGCLLAIAATNDNAVNRAVYDACKERGILVNVVDVPELCDFYVPASVQRGDLQLTVSSGGACPALSKKLRRELEQHFGPEYGPYLRLAERLRLALLDRVEEPARRKEALSAFLASDALAMLAQGREEEAERLLAEHMARLPDGESKH